MILNVNDWLAWDQKEVLPFEGSISIHVRTESRCVVKTTDGLPLAVGDGEQYITISGDGEIQFDCENTVWLRPSSRVQDRVQASTEVFTSYDRPAPLTPEMAAIQRMMRRNEMDRQRDREEMEQRIARYREPTEREPSGPAPAGSADKEEEVRPDKGGSADDAPKQEPATAGKKAPPDRVPEQGADGDPPS